MKDTSPASDGQQESISRRVIAVAGSFVVVVLALCFAYWVFFAVPKQAAREAGEVTAGFFEKLFNLTPKVTIHNTVLIQETKSISELATAEKPIVVTHKFENVRLYSKKTFEVRAEYLVTAGFNFANQGCSVAVEERPLTIAVKFPKPVILSATMKSFEILNDENGLLNKLTTEEREQAIRGLTPEAIRRARDTSSILEDARSSVKKQLQAKAQERNWKLDVKFE